MNPATTEMLKRVSYGLKNVDACWRKVLPGFVSMAKQRCSSASVISMVDFGYDKSYTHDADFKKSGMWGSELLADIYASIAAEHTTPTGGESAPSALFELSSRCPRRRRY
jgi:hypothetical protein